MLAASHGASLGYVVHSAWLFDLKVVLCGLQPKQEQQNVIITQTSARGEEKRSIVCGLTGFLEDTEGQKKLYEGTQSAVMLQ